MKIEEGGELPIIRGFQGFSEIFLSYQTLGYTPGGRARINLHIELMDGTVVYGDPYPNNLTVNCTSIGSGINVCVNDYWLITTGPDPFYNKLANVTLTVSDDTNPSISVTLEQTVFLVEP